jgi:hypothetical protein
MTIVCNEGKFEMERRGSSFVAKSNQGTQDQLTPIMTVEQAFQAPEGIDA